MENIVSKMLYFNRYFDTDDRSTYIISHERIDSYIKLDATKNVTAHLVFLQNVKFSLKRTSKIPGICEFEENIKKFTITIVIQYGCQMKA